MPIIADSSRDKSRDRWLEVRRRGVTSTEAAALATGRKTVAALYKEKHYGSGFAGNLYTQWGNLMEPSLIDFLRQITKEHIVDNSDVWHAEFDKRFLSTPDGVGDGFVAEVKTTGRTWENMHDESIPVRERFALNDVEHYYLQVQDQMLVTGTSRCLFAWVKREVNEDCRVAWENGKPVASKLGETDLQAGDVFHAGKYDWLEIEEDPAAQEELKEWRHKFFEYSPAAAPSVPSELWELKNEEKNIRARLKRISARVDEITEKAGFHVGDSYEYPEGKITVYQRKGRNTFNKKLLKEEHPDVYKKYVEGYTTVSEPVAVTKITLSED
ncbi:MAG: YqaJ viral recombinase family protein [Lawsonella sp.]